MLKDYEVIADGVDAPFLATAPTSEAAISDFRLWYAAQYGRHFVGHVWADLVCTRGLRMDPAHQFEKAARNKAPSKSGIILADDMARFAEATPGLSVIRAALLGS